MWEQSCFGEVCCIDYDVIKWIEDKKTNENKEGERLKFIWI